MADDIPTWKTFTEGDTDAVHAFAIVDTDGNPVDLTGKIVTLEGRRRGAAAEFAPIVCTVTGAAAGEGEVSCATLTVAAGEYRTQIRAASGGIFYRTDVGKIVVRGEARAGNA